jgi:hypothetical protein
LNQQKFASRVEVLVHEDSRHDPCGNRESVSSHRETVDLDTILGAREASDFQSLGSLEELFLRYAQEGELAIMTDVLHTRPIVALGVRSRDLEHRGSRHHMCCGQDPSAGEDDSRAGSRIGGRTLPGSR